MKGGIEHINRTSPCVGIAEGKMVGLGSGEELYGGFAMGHLRGVVVEVNRIVDGEGPEILVRLFRPVERGMNEHGASL